MNLILSTIALGSGMQEPATYAKNSSLQWNLVKESLDNYPWKGNERVLDVGCGHGALTSKIAESVPDGYVIGLDLSEKMIAFASESLEQSGLRNLIFMAGDATNLPFYNQFDVVVSTFALHWVLEQEKAYRSLYQTLAPGGKLFIVEAAKRNNYVGPLTEQLVQNPKWEPYFKEYKNQRVYLTEKEAYELLNKTGFTPLSIKTSTTTTVFADKNALVGYLRPQLTFIAHLSDKLKAEFASDLADAMIALDIVDSEGKIHYMLDKIEIIALKPDR